jgi:hypothetical protein
LGEVFYPSSPPAEKAFFPLFNLKTAVQATKTKKAINHRDTEKNIETDCF